MEILIHAGRHKSGTSSIQRTLYNNRKVLSDMGVLYPHYGCRGYGHHELAERLSIKNESDETSYNEALEIWNNILKSSGPSQDKIVLSSEAFQNCSPLHIASFFKGHSVKVVFYVRNKVDYLASAYLQKVHATDYSGCAGSFLNNHFNVDYSKYINQWVSVFEKNCILRIFDRATLVNGDVCEDFFYHFLPKVVSWEKIENDVNPSLPVEVLEFKKALNNLYPELAFDQRVYSALSLASIKLKDSNKFVVPDSAFFKVLGKVKEGDNTVENVSGVSVPFQYPIKRRPDFNKDVLLKVKHFFDSVDYNVDFEKIENAAMQSFNIYSMEFDSSIRNVEKEVFFAENYSKSIDKKGVIFSDGVSETFSLPKVARYGVGCSDKHLSEANFRIYNRMSYMDYAKVLLPHGVIINGNEILEESLWMSKLNRSSYAEAKKDFGWKWLVDKSATNFDLHVSGRVLICYSNTASNYFHWHFEILAKLWEYIAKFSLENIDYVYTGCFSENSFKFKSLIAIGVPREKILNDISSSFSADTIVYPLLNSEVDIPLLQRMKPSGGIHHKGWSKSFCLEFPEYVRRNISSFSDVKSKKLFVNRIENGNRKIINESEVKDFLISSGFEEIDPGMVDYETQVEKFSQASIVVGIHGAGLTNTIYCRDNVNVVELIPNDYEDVGYRMLCQIKNMAYIPIYCDQPVKIKEHPKNDDIFVDLKILAELVI